MDRVHYSTAVSTRDPFRFFGHRRARPADHTAVFSARPKSASIDCPRPFLPPAAHSCSLSPGILPKPPLPPLSFLARVSVVCVFSFFFLFFSRPGLRRVSLGNVQAQSHAGAGVFRGLPGMACLSYLSLGYYNSTAVDHQQRCRFGRSRRGASAAAV